MASFLQNAQNFAFQGTIVNAAGGYYVQNGPIKDPRERLHDNITSGAMHNSAERCVAPKCHAETRIAVQEEIFVWITHGQNDEQPKRVLWLSGPAGTGKTAIAGSIAELWKEKGLLAATFFFSSFSGSRERCSKRRLITTIAYQLLQHDSLHEVGRRMLSAIDKNPAVFQLRLKDQLEELILVPLRDVLGQGVDSSSWPKVIIIDGLDEVEPDDGEGLGSSGGQRTKDEVHLEILSVLLHAVNDPAFPFRVLIVSRPEKAIRGFFAGQDARDLTLEIFLDKKYNPDADITLFLKSKFAVIRDEYSLPSTWPTEDAIRVLVRNASGQFIYADTVIRYVSDRTKLPKTQLDQVLKVGTPAGGETNPFATLDALYTRILSSSPDPRLVVKWLITIFRGGMHYPAFFWRQFLELEEGEGVHLFSNLVSLISTPPPHNPVTQYVVYHKSLFDFVFRIPAYSSIYVTANSYNEFYGTRFVRVLKNRGPATSQPMSEAERNVFLRRFTLGCFLGPVPCYLISPEWQTPGSLKHTVSSDDAAWLIDTALSFYDCSVHTTSLPDLKDCLSTWSQVLAGYFWEAHYKCPWYRCLPSCRLWRSPIIQVCRARGWTTPAKLVLFYNRFVKWELATNVETGEKYHANYPSGTHFSPPPNVEGVTVAIPREPMHPKDAQQHHNKRERKHNDQYCNSERSNFKASTAVFPLS